MNEREIEAEADAILAAFEYTVPPIDPLGIAKREGIKLAPGDYGGCFDGRIEYLRRGQSGRFYLFYAQERRPHRPEGRVRFSVAHELGHYYLPTHRKYLLSGVWHGSRVDFVSEKPVEREADHFAACLLLPRRFFAERVKARSGSVCTIKDLSKLAEEDFRTSLTSTVIRYCQLNFEPCCVVLSAKGQVKSSFRSDDMQRCGLGWLDRGSPVPAPSITGRYFASLTAGSPCPSEGSIEADVWFENRRSLPLWEEVRPLGNTGLILTFLTAEGEDTDGDDE